MDHIASRGWVTTMALLATSAETQGKTIGDMAETMRTGLVPLFAAIGAGMLVMATLTVIAVLWLRPPLPPLDA